MNKKTISKTTNQTILFTLISFITFFLISDCSIREPEQPNYHLVIDAGSSGTRFCLFQMKYSNETPHCKVRSGECQNITATNGLATLNNDQIEQVIQEGFTKIQNANRLRINHVALLGTGGFRALPDSARNNKISQVANIIFKTGYASTVKVISGEDEAWLAWRSIGAENGSHTHGIIEIGGATLQVAAGKNNIPISKVSYPLGMNTVKAKIKSDSACFSKPAPNRFIDCQNELRPLLGSIKPAFENTQLIYYGLGNPIQAVFHQLKQNQIKATQIESMGNEVCQSNSDQLTDLGIQTKFQADSCYLFAFQSIVYQNTGLSQLRKADTSSSWPTGASTSGDYFPECR